MTRLPRRTLLGIGVAFAAMVVLTLAMVPLRRYLSIADDGLVLIVPVVIGAALGGFGAGVVSVLAGFAAYDFVFIPPYYTPWVGAPGNWIAPCVYLVVMIVVSRVVASKDAARREAKRQKDAISKLFEISKFLVEDKSLSELLSAIVTTLREAFALRTVAVLPESELGTELEATTGVPLLPDELDAVRSGGESRPDVLRVIEDRPDTITAISLATEGRTIGWLVLVGHRLADGDEQAIRTFANEAALAVERVRLREDALRAQLMGEVERLAKTLLAAASHDLRTPLASIKTIATTLSDADLQLAPDRRRELARLIDAQADRLARLVKNLLDISRIQAGVLELRRELVSLAVVVREALQSLGPAIDPSRVEIRITDDLPFVEIDRLLIGQVICNLVENAARHAPSGTPIVIAATERADCMEVSVSDRGPGMPLGTRFPQAAPVFTTFDRRPGDAGGGLGLSIARAFVEAHGESIVAESELGGGARFSFSIAKVLRAQEDELPVRWGPSGSVNVTTAGATSSRH